MNYSREQYIEERKINFVNYHLAWEMFKIHKGPKPELNKKQFLGAFHYWCKITPSLDGYFDYYDRLFEVIYVFDKHNNLIAIK